jgi:hypothetical protein
MECIWLGYLIINLFFCLFISVRPKIRRIVTCQSMALICNCRLPLLILLLPQNHSSLSYLCSIFPQSIESTLNWERS